MTEQEIQLWKDKIDRMDQVAMARLHRFAYSGHPVFDIRNADLYEYFVVKFSEAGGMTSAISKTIGWEQHG